MVALLIGIAVSAVWMGTMLPAWRTQAQREKEAELIFRLEQCGRAIALFQKKNGTLPLNFDLLVSQHYIRQKYKDPITGKDFMTLAQAPQGNQPGGIIECRSTSQDRSIRVYNNQQQYAQWSYPYQLALQRMGQAIGPRPPGQRPGGPGQRGGTPPGRGTPPGGVGPRGGFPIPPGRGGAGPGPGGNQPVTRPGGPGGAVGPGAGAGR
jgi:hypothetical protein